MKTPPSLEGELRQLVATRVPGVAVVIVGAEGVRARAAAGLADLACGMAMATDVAVPWFSMTKLVTATTVMALAARGVLPLDTPLLPLVPAMSGLRPVPWAQTITARHLLQHSGGLANPIPLRWVHPAASPGPDPEAFLGTHLAKHPKLRSKPGTGASYSNLGSLLLAAAITKATGASFEDVVRGEVLQPAGMTHTDFSYPAAGPVATGNHPRYDPMRLLLPRWVTGHPHGRWLTLRPFLVDGSAYGGLVGSADDAARFLQMHLAGGRIDDQQVISAADAATMSHINQPGKRYDLGLGWFTPAKSRAAQPAFVEHLGGGAGFFNLIRMYPSAGVGIVVMGNATRYDIEVLARLALTHTE